MINNLFTVIVNWNLKEDTIHCVDSLFKAGIKNGHVIVVDNGSNDGSVTELQEKYGSSIIIIQNKENLGYTMGVNIGIQYALNNNAKWILLLNNDAYVEEKFIVEMENAIKQDDRISIIGPVILYHENPNRIWFLGSKLIPKTLITYSLYKNHIYDLSLPSLFFVDFISGCCMLIKSDVFNTIGYFDTSYIMYGEEVDWCWRAINAGYKIAVATKAKMWHKISTSSNRVKPITHYLKIRNQIRFYRTYSYGLKLILMFVFSVAHTAIILINDIFHKQYKLILPLYRGFLDGWKD